MKPDEREFLLLLLKERPRSTTCGKDMDAIINQLNMNGKRANSILLKWTDKGWWNYGVSPFGGWFERKGIDAAEQLKEQTK